VTPAAVVTTLRAAGVVFAEDEATLLLEAATDPADLTARIARRCDGEPLELVVGWAAFDGLRVPVAPGVFVPRRRSEALVETADRLLASTPAGERVVVLDLCCGTGALGVALSLRLLARGLVVDLTLADHDPRATTAAAATLQSVGVAGSVVTGDLFAAVPSRLGGRVDVLLTNVPYVPSAEVALLPSEARDHEPRNTLDGGADGLAVLRRVAAEAGEWLAPRGLLLTEATGRQAPAAAQALAGPGRSVHVVADEDRDVSVVVATSHDR
jgi:release factor glutamine methyltransferase